MQVKLSHILSSLESGGRPKGGASLDSKGIPSLGAEHLDSSGGFNFKSVKYIPEDYFNELKNGIIERENILIVKDGATTGKVSFVCEDFPFEKASVNEHVFLLKIDKSKAYPKFAFQYLKCPQGQRDIMRDFRGATVGGISRGFIEFVKFELPSLPDQLHIANILSKAENLIVQRKESIRLLDEFLKSTFLEMFGDPVRNEKGWGLKTLKDVCSKIQDGTHFSPPIVKEGRPYITAKHVRENKIDFWANPWFISEESHNAIYKRCNPVKSDVLYIKDGATTGFAAINRYDFEFSMLSSLALLKANKQVINSEYLCSWLNNPSVKANILTKMAGGAIKRLTLTKINILPILVPPIKLQTQFAQIVEKTEALKTQYQQSLQELENLYGSLSQRAFRGELKSKSNKESLLMAADPTVAYQSKKQSAIPENKKGFAKLVLAGKIISECKDNPEFTNIKFQKLQHLAEHLMEADLNLNYYNQAAGPYDNKFMHTLHDKMKQQKWFASKGYKYFPLEKANEIKGHFGRYFGVNNEQFSKLIKLLGKASENQCEIISTLYAVWNDRVIKKVTITNEGLIEDFFNWSERKQKYTGQQLTKAIKWMKENELEPIGFGELIKHIKQKKKA